MADLIDRQAAIDAIDGVFMEDDSYKTCLYLAIQNIPSVQTKPDSDCISRERTLNAIAEYLEEYNETDQDGNYDPKWCAMKEAELLVNDMPSVQSDKGDCISKAETLEALNTWDKFACIANEQLVPMRELDNPEHYVPYIKYGDAYNCVMNMPSVHPERKKGKWIDMGDFEQCSVCGCTQLKEFQSYYGKTLWVKSKFCPGCGAELRSEENDNA